MGHNHHLLGIGRSSLVLFLIVCATLHLLNPNLLVHLHRACSTVPSSPMNAAPRPKRVVLCKTALGQVAVAVGAAVVVGAAVAVGAAAVVRAAVLPTGLLSPESSQLCECNQLIHRPKRLHSQMSKMNWNARNCAPREKNF